MFDDVAQQFGAGQFAGVQVAPLLQYAAGAVFVALLQRVADVGEVVAELAEAERQVQDQQVEAERGDQGSGGSSTRKRAPDHQRRREHGRHPNHPGVVLLPASKLRAVQRAQSISAS